LYIFTTGCHCSADIAKLSEDFQVVRQEIQQLDRKFDEIQRLLTEGATRQTAAAVNLNDTVMRLPAENMEELDAWEVDLGDEETVKTVVIKTKLIKKL